MKKVQPKKNSNDGSEFNIFSAIDAFEPMQPIDWYVDNLISVASLTALVGHPGCMKTWVMLTMAVCIATGKKWAGLTTKQSNVLFIDEESGPRRLL